MTDMIATRHIRTIDGHRIMFGQELRKERINAWTIRIE